MARIVADDKTGSKLKTTGRSRGSLKEATPERDTENKKTRVYL